MLVPKFTLIQGFRLMVIAAVVSVVLAEAWREQNWAVALTLSAGMALGVAAFSAAGYWLFLGLGWCLSRRDQGTSPEARGTSP